MKKVWYADNEGGASGDVLVLQVNKNCNSKFVYYNLKQDKFFEYEMLGIKEMKMPRGDKKQIMNYQIPVPPLSVQQEIVTKIEGYEAQIAAY